MVSALLLAVITSNAPIAHTPRTVAYNSARSQMLDDLNATRRSNGLRPLVLTNNLTSAAASHASDMAANNYFDHYSRNGNSPFDRMHQSGVKFGYAGENIAMSQSEREAETALLQSPEHRENILNAHYTHVGIGVAAQPDGTLLFVQDFSD